MKICIVLSLAAIVISLTVIVVSFWPIEHRPDLQSINGYIVTGEWTGPPEKMPILWTRVKERRLARHQFGQWSHWIDIDDKSQFAQNGRPLKIDYDKGTAEIINGSTNIFTGEYYRF